MAPLTLLWRWAHLASRCAGHSLHPTAAQISVRTKDELSRCSLGRTPPIRSEGIPKMSTSRTLYSATVVQDARSSRPAYDTSFVERWGGCLQQRRRRRLATPTTFERRGVLLIGHPREAARCR